MRVLLLILSALLHGGGPDHDAAPPPYGPPSWAYAFTPGKDALLCSFADCPDGTHCELIEKLGWESGKKAVVGRRAICVADLVLH